MRWPAAPFSQPDAAQNSEFDDFLLAMMVTVLCSVACLLVWLSSWAITRRMDASPPHTPHGRRVNFANDDSVSQRRARERGVAQSATWPQLAPSRRVVRKVVRPRLITLQTQDEFAAYVDRMGQERPRSGSSRYTT